jgi:hypothetical protein
VRSREHSEAVPGNAGLHRSEHLNVGSAVQEKVRVRN